MSRRKLKFVGIGLLIIGIFWTRVEELNTALVSIFGICTSLWVVINQQFIKNKFNLLNVLIPFIWIVTPITLMLMVFKNGLHGHNFPEYSMSQTKEILFRMPYILIIGYGIKFWVGKKTLENNA